MNKKKITKLITIVLLVALFIYLFPFVKDLANVDQMRAFLAQFGILAPVVFGLIYIIAGILFVPLSLFSILAGVLFGTLNAFIIVLVSATFASMAGFLISRQFSSLIPKAKGGLIFKFQSMIEKRLEKSTFETIAILRLLYLSYMGVSYGAGLVKSAKFWPFVLATFLTNLPGVFVFVYLGGELASGWKALLLPVGLIALTLLIPRIVKKFTK